MDDIVEVIAKALWDVRYSSKCELTINWEDCKEKYKKITFRGYA